MSIVLELRLGFANRLKLDGFSVMDCWLFSDILIVSNMKSLHTLKKNENIKRERRRRRQKVVKKTTRTFTRFNTERNF